MATFPTLRAAPAPPKPRLRRSTATSLTLFPAAPNGTCEARGASSPPPDANRSLKPAENLVGIARLAASSSSAEAKRGTEYFLLPVRSILNRCNSPRVPFAWTVNPYRGCEFGCHYCYARYTHEYMELDGGDFERKIYVKENAGALVERDLENEKIWGEHIAIGTATDPYQPAEGEFKATRAVLEQMAKREGLQLSITTKSNRVVRDIELLKKISERSALTVNLSVTTVSSAPGASAGTSRAASGPEARRRAPFARRRHFRRRIGDADCAGNHRRRGRARRACEGRARRWRAMVRRTRAVPDAFGAEAVHSIRRSEIPETGEAVSRVVCQARQRTGELSPRNFGARRALAEEVWLRCAA